MADTYLFTGNERHHAHFTTKEAGEIALESNVKKLVLTHLPQFGDLTQLKQEACQATQEQIPVELAEINKVFLI